ACERSIAALRKRHGFAEPDRGCGRNQANLSAISISRSPNRRLGRCLHYEKRMEPSPKNPPIRSSKPCDVGRQPSDGMLDGILPYIPSKILILLHKWRMGWDSNPREACTPAGFQDRCLKPLGHPSKYLKR